MTLLAPLDASYLLNKSTGNVSIHSAATTYLACNIEMVNMFLSTHLALRYTSCLLRNRGMRSLLLIQLSSKSLVHLVILDVVLLSSRLLIQFMPRITPVASCIILYLSP